MPEFILLTDPDGTNRIVPKTPKMINFIDKVNAGEVENKQIKKGITFPSEEAGNAYLSENPKVHGHSPIAKVGMLQNIVKDQQDEIAQLKAALAAKSQEKQSTPPPPADNEPIGVRETLALIPTLKTVAELESLLVNEERKTVVEAVNKAITKLKIS